MPEISKQEKELTLSQAKGEFSDSGKRKYAYILAFLEKGRFNLTVMTSRKRAVASAMNLAECDVCKNEIATGYMDQLKDKFSIAIDKTMIYKRPFR